MARRSWKVKTAPAAILALAETYCDDHAKRIARGYRLTAASGMWRTKGRGVTLRLVYRATSGDGMTTITHVIRGLPG